ncbi:MAG: PAS domain-containing protein, partial [Rhodocyclaceae bacterium]|nr:PAS domain-containing protein [Rhodocyclaceae bacterium]
MDPSSADETPGAVPTGLARALLDAIPAHTAILDRRGTIVAVNAAWQDFSDAHCGASCLRLAGSGVGANYLDTCRRCVGLGADQGLAAARGLEAVLAGRADRYTLEYPCHGPEAERWFVLEATPLEVGDAACLVTHWEVTQRRADADALRESRDRYAALVDNSLDAVLLTSPDGGVLAANPAACAMFGRTAAEMARGRRDDLIDATDPRLAAGIEERARTGRFHGELRYRRRDGSLFPGETSSSVFTDRTGALRTSTTIRDVGARHRAEAALRESEARYRDLFDSMAQGAFLQGADGTLLDINPAGLELLGLTREEFLGRTSMHPAWRVVREDGSPWPADAYPSMVALRTGRPVTGQVTGVFNPRRGEFVWMTVNAIPRLGGDGRPVDVHVTLHDITESRRAGQELAAV